MAGSFATLFSQVSLNPVRRWLIFKIGSFIFPEHGCKLGDCRIFSVQVQVHSLSTVPIAPKNNQEQTEGAHALMSGDNNEIPYIGHTPVLVKETLQALGPKDNQVVFVFVFY